MNKGTMWIVGAHMDFSVPQGSGPAIRKATRASLKHPLSSRRSAWPLAEVKGPELRSDPWPTISRPVRRSVSRTGPGEWIDLVAGIAFPMGLDVVIGFMDRARDA